MNKKVKYRHPNNFMKKPNKADFERIRDGADREAVQLAIQTDINALVHKYVEKKLKECPDDKPTGVG